MENVKKKMPLVVVIAIAAYLVLGAVVSSAEFVIAVIRGLNNGAEVLELLGSSFGDLVGAFFGSIWVIGLGVYAAVFYSKSQKHILLPISLAIGSLTAIAPIFETGRLLFAYVKYAFSDLHISLIVSTLFTAVVLLLAIVVFGGLVAMTIGCFANKYSIAKIGSVAYAAGIVLMPVVSIVQFVARFLFGIGFTVNIYNRITGVAGELVAIILAAALVVLFFKYMKKDKAEEPVAEIEEIVAEVVAE